MRCSIPAGFRLELMESRVSGSKGGSSGWDWEATDGSRTWGMIELGKKSGTARVRFVPAWGENGGGETLINRG